METEIVSRGLEQETCVGGWAGESWPDGSARRPHPLLPFDMTERLQHNTSNYFNTLSHFLCISDHLPGSPRHSLRKYRRLPLTFPPPKEMWQIPHFF